MDIMDIWILIVLVVIALQAVLIMNLLWRVLSLEARIDRIKLYLEMCADGSPTAIQQCADAIKRMGEAFSQFKVKIPTKEEG